MLSSCHKKVGNPNKGLTLDAFSELEDKRYRIDIHKIRDNIAIQIKDDSFISSAERQVSKYYSGNNPFIWINRNGLYSRTDTLFQ